MIGGRSAAALGFCLLLGSCRGQGLLVGDPEADLGTSGGETDAPVAPPSCPNALELRRLDDDCWPTRHVGRWRGFVTSEARYLHLLEASLEYPSDGVLLEIDAQGGATLMFFSGDAGSALADAAPAPGLVSGYRYALAGVSMSGGASDARKQDPRVDFTLTIAEPWDPFCTGQSDNAGSAPCTCGDRGCAAAPEVLRGALSLSADASALRGSAQTGDPPASLSAGWEFVRE